MQIDRIIYPVTALGPGNRLCIWMVGCKKRCPMCANPELQNFDVSKEIKIEEIKKIFVSAEFLTIDGFTISGGEPFCQPKELLNILKFFKGISEDILVFSGYTYEELVKMDDYAVQSCLDYIGVLIAGPYIDELNDNETALIASSNQTVHYLRSNLRDKYSSYICQGRQIQNVFYKNEMISVGIHNREEKET